jgi:hypothetical protein
VGTGQGISTSETRVTTRTGSAKHHIKTMVVRSGEGEMILEEKDGGRTLVVKDSDDKLIFEGPINTSEEREKMPPEVRQRLEKIEEKIQQDLPKKDKVEQMRIISTQKKPRFF